MKNRINLINGLLSTSCVKKQQLVILIVFCFISQYTYSRSYHVPDSLNDKTYKELYKNLNLNFNDTIKGYIYINAYLNKAKKENDTIRIANAYSQFASITSNNLISIQYCDSIINLTLKLKNPEYPGFAYMTKGIVHFKLGNDQKALDNYLIAHKYAERHNNFAQLLYIESLVGMLKTFIGKNDEALISFKKILNSLKDKKINFENSDQLYLNTLFSISNSFLIEKKYDSALVYTKIGIKKSIVNKDFLNYYNFVSQSGYIAYYQNNYKTAIDSLDKALPHETSSNGLLNDNYYRGNIYLKQKIEEKAFYHFKKADSIYNSSNEVVSEVRDIQEYFVNYYKNIGDTENQLVYIDRLLKVDSILNRNYKNLNETLIKKYDTPILLSQKENIINNLKAKHQNSIFTILGLTVIIVLFVLFFMWYNYKNKTIIKKTKEVVIKPIDKSEDKTLKSSSKEVLKISKEVIDSVLNSLTDFESNHEFLENKLTLNKLSKKLNTNSNYLSKIINTEKQMNFSSYISNLRLEYCLEKIKTDSKFRKYTITAIAFEIGFNNVESFSKAFYKKTNTYPSSYIKKIEKSRVA